MSSFKVATILRSPITVHWTLPLYALFVVSQLGMTLGIPFMFMMIGSVLLHELGHVWVAQKRGIETGEINLNVFGGMASMNLGRKASATDELLVALAGPAVSLILSAIVFVPALTVAAGNAQSAMFYFSVANAVIALFNLLPAFPMDGGRVLRSCLRYKLGYKTATQASVYVAYAVFTAVAVIAAIWHQWFLVAMIGLLATGAALEKKSVEE